MKAQNNQFTIHSVLFESNDPEILVKGNISKGVMNYDTDLIITHTQLNQLMNLLQKQNTETGLYDLLKSEEMYNGETLYSADFSELASNKINLSYLTGSEMMKQIRA